MVYEEIAEDIKKAKKPGYEAHVGDLTGLEMFRNWPEESFDAKIELYERTDEPEKAEAIRVIRDFCIPKKKVEKKA